MHPRTRIAALATPPAKHSPVVPADRHRRDPLHQVVTTTVLAVTAALAVAIIGLPTAAGIAAIGIWPAALGLGLLDTYRRSHQARHEFDHIDERASVARALGDKH